MANEKISIVVPCYNEALTVAKVVRAYRKAFPEATVFVYNNNSTDATAFLAEEAGAVVRNVLPKGKGCVLRQAFRDIDADCYMIVDGDDTYPVGENTKRMADMVLNDGYDMVIGNRLNSGYFKESKSPLHSIGNKIVPWLLKVLYCCKIHDVMSGSRAFSKSFVKSFPAVSDGFVIETEMMLYAIKTNRNVGEVDVGYKDRPAGSVSKINSIKDGTKIIWHILKNRFF